MVVDFATRSHFVPSVFLKKLVYFFFKNLGGKAWWDVENYTNIYLFHWKWIVSHTMVDYWLANDSSGLETVQNSHKSLVTWVLTGVLSHGNIW